MYVGEQERKRGREKAGYGDRESNMFVLAREVLRFILYFYLIMQQLYTRWLCIKIM